MILNTELEYKGDLFPSRITDYSKDVDVLYFSTANNVILQLTVLRDSVFRFRYTTVGKFDNDFSYAIDRNASRGYNHLEISEDDEKYIVSTSRLICHIYKLDLRKSIIDAIDSSVICEDELGFHWEESYELGGDIVKMSKAAKNGESYYGLGDKPSHLNLKGRRFENWRPILMPTEKIPILFTKPFHFIPLYTIIKPTEFFSITPLKPISIFVMKDAM